MDSAGFLIFTGIFVNFLLFVGSILSMTLLVDYLSTGRYWWLPVPIIVSSILLLIIEPGIPLSVLGSFSSGVSFKSLAAVFAGGLAFGGILSGV